MANPAEIPDPDSVFSVQTDSDLDASRYTEHSYGREYALPLPLEAETASISTVQPSQASNSYPSNPSSQSPPDSSKSSETTLIWNDMGPHNEGDETHPLFLDLYSMKYLLELKTTQWFLKHLLIEHRSLAHRHLIVSLLITV